MSTLTPREIVSELDKFIIGQAEAKRMVAIAMRNRWRRQQIDPELRDEIAPKNIIMMGPTGVGKTEVARRLARLAGCPFFKVEATKFTEVGYVGRDVESMIRDLMEISVSMVKQEERGRVRQAAEQAAEEKLLDLLLPKSGRAPVAEGQGFVMTGAASSNLGPSERDAATRDKLRMLWKKGELDDREVELEVTSQGGPGVEIMAMPGMEDMGMQMQ
ncbi:MAG: AAA family ATPase, partial [Desulfovibrionaceae bacterium]